jgi:hypothetical protein
MPLEDWVQHTKLDRFLYDWQTLVAGFLALLAAIGTIWATRSTASRQITAAREQADRMVAAAREQTRATFKQTETTFDLEQMRNASEALSFHAMLEAAMARVLAEAAWARRTYPHIVGQAQGASIDAQGASVDALTVRQCITKGAFAELRAACIRRGGDLTGEFLDLEREIDGFAMQWEDKIVNAGVLVRWGKHAGLGEQLALIERKAAELRQKAFVRFSGSVAAPGPFATAEAEALIGAPAPAEAAPRRSWARWWFGLRARG